MAAQPQETDEFGGVAVSPKTSAPQSDEFGGVPVSVASQSQSAPSERDEFGGVPAATVSDSNYDPVSEAARHQQGTPEWEHAFAVDQARSNRPFSTQVGEAVKSIPGALVHGVGAAIKFGLGLGLTGFDTLRQSWDSAIAGGADLAGADEMSQDFGRKAAQLKAENILAGQSNEEGLRNVARIVKQNPATRFIAPVGSDVLMDMIRDDPKTDFANRVEHARRMQQLAGGTPLDTGALSALATKDGSAPLSQTYGPEGLSAVGAEPVRPLAVEMKTAAGDPMNLLLAKAPGLPGASTAGGRITQGFGKAAQLPMAGVEAGAQALAHLGPVGKIAAGLTGAGGAYHAAAAAVAHPAAAAVAAVSALGVKGLQILGRAAEAQGKEMATGIPSQYTTAAAKAAATGTSNIGANVMRGLGNAAGSAVTTPLAMAPVNALLAEGDPKKFAESEAGAATFGGALGGFNRNRPMLVEAIRPHLQQEGAWALTQAANGNDPLARRSIDYLNTLPDEARNRTLEAIGALQGLPTNTPNGPARAKLYVLNDSDYRDVIAQKFGMQQAAMGGGRGFYIGDDGAAYVNGDYHSGLPAGELAHTIGHEFGGHAAINVMQAMGAKGGALYNGMVQSARDALMPNGRPTADFYEFVRNYNHAFDPTGQTQRLDLRNPESIEEFIAETAGHIMANRGAGELAIPQNIQDKISQGIGRFMGSMVGMDTRTIGGDTHFGRKEVGAVTQAVQDTLGQIVGMKLRGGAEIPEPPKSDTTRITELQQTLNTPRPRPGSPLEEVRQWISDQKSARSELSSLQQGQTGAFPAAGTPPVAPSAPQAPNVPAPAPTPSRASVAAALRLNGIPSAEAQQWAQQAQGSTVEEMVLDALKRRAGQKFPSQTPVAPTPNGAQVPENQPEVSPTAANTPTPNEPTTSTTGEELPPEPTRTATIPERPPNAEEPATLSEDSISEIAARAEEAVKSARTNRHKPSTLPKAVSDAQVDAVAAAHEQGLPANYQGVRARTDALGKKTISGTFNPSRPFDAFLLKLADLSQKHVGILQDIQSKLGQTVTVNYGHAPEESGEVTAGSRKAAQAASSAQARASGEAEAQNEDKNFIPLQVSFNKGKDSPSITVLGASPEKLLNNFNLTASAVRELGGDVPYRDIHDPHLVADMKGVARNHANGWKGDGSARIESFPDVTVPTPADGYKPYPIPEDRFEFLNVMLGDESAKTGKKGASPEQTLKQGLAAKNQIPMTEAGETNMLRESINRAKGPVTGHDGEPTTWSKATIENPLSEALRVDLINEVKPEVSNEDASIRPSGYKGDIGRFFGEGSPNRTFTASGFLPDTGAPKTAKEKAQERIAERAKFMPDDSKPEPEAGTPGGKRLPSGSQPNLPEAGGTSPKDSGKPEDGETSGERLMREAEAAGLQPSLDTMKAILRGDQNAYQKLRAMIRDRTGKDSKFMPRESLDAEGAVAKAEAFDRKDPSTWPADIGKGVEEPDDRQDSWLWALSPKEKAQMRQEIRDKPNGYDVTRFQTIAKKKFAQLAAEAQMRADSLKKQVDAKKFFFMPDGQGSSPSPTPKSSAPKFSPMPDDRKRKDAKEAARQRIAARR